MKREREERRRVRGYEESYVGQKEES